jgi:hypothetical protein
LKQRSSTPIGVLWPLAPHATQGFLLVSKTYAVYHAADAEPVQDDNIMISAGVRSTEHSGYKNPFHLDAQSRHDLATHAGSVSYIFAKSYNVHCDASRPDSNGTTYVTCSIPSDGMQLAKIRMRLSRNIAKLREIITMVVSSNLSGASPLHLNLLSPDGTVLSDMASIADAFGLF